MADAKVAVDQLYDIYDMVHVPWWQTRAAYGVAGAFALIVCGALLWIIIKKIRSRTKRLTVWEIALLDAQVLKQFGTVHPDDLYYLKLTEILKRYLSNRYALDLYGKTDEEMIQLLETASVPASLIEKTRVLLQESVMIKFAQLPAVSAQKENSVALLVLIIKSTIPTAESNKTH